MSSKKIVILISGSTATGKTNLALSLGTNLPIEIINADIGSFYTNLNIGTAKPNWKISKIKHHFFDVIQDCSSWTSHEFREKLDRVIKEIWERGSIPVIVGGSAFYVQSFFYKQHKLHAPTKELIVSLSQEPSDVLWEKLKEVDPIRADKISKQDHYRLVRALTIWYTQGKKPSELEQIFDPLAPFYFITVTRDRDQLYEIINNRVISMMQDGWLDEIRSLISDETWVDFLCNKKIIGYDLLIEYLLGYQSEKSLEEIVELIQQKTRNYAKRQVTFLKKLQKNIKNSMVANKNYNNYKIEEYNLSFISSDELIDIINQDFVKF
jgi:tRNA dimethylallyltransferase